MSILDKIPSNIYDLGCVGIEDSAPASKSQTSDKYKDEAKIFLSEINITTEKITKHTYKILSDIKSQSMDIIPPPGQIYRMRTQQQINLISILMLIAKEGHIDELIITTYTLNKEAFEVIKDLYRAGMITKVQLYLSATLSFRVPEYYKQIKADCIDLFIALLYETLLTNCCAIFSATRKLFVSGFFTSFIFRLTSFLVN